MTKEVRLGIIGAGWWAVENHIPVLRSNPDVVIAGVCRPGTTELNEICRRFNISFGTEDYRELLSLEGLDGVIVSSPHDCHFEHARDALNRRISVLCEKPMTLRAAEARELESLAGGNGLHFVLAYGWNYMQFASEAKRILASGEIGDIVHVQCHMASALLDLFSGEGAWFAESAPVKPEMETWSDPLRGGGFGYGQLAHALGLLFHITNLTPENVFCMTSVTRTGADLTSAICCRFREGATGMIGGAATMPPGSVYQLDIRVFGREGMLLFDLERPRLTVRRRDGKDHEVALGINPGFYECSQPLNVFVELLQGKATENCSPASVGRKAIEVLDAAFRSTKSGSAEHV